jgi:hypothetical protein
MLQSVTTTSAISESLLLSNTTVRSLGATVPQVPSNSTVTNAHPYNPTQPVTTGTITVSGALVTLTALADGDILFNNRTIVANPTQPVAIGLTTISGIVYTATLLRDGDVLVANMTIESSSTTPSMSINHPSITGRPFSNSTNPSASNTTIPTNQIQVITLPLGELTITRSPNAAMTAPSGYGSLGNSTFPTSCAYGDIACFSTCSSMAEMCSPSWNPFNSEVEDYMLMTYPLSWVAVTTVMETMVITSTSYALSMWTSTFTETLAFWTSSNSKAIEVTTTQVFSQSWTYAVSTLGLYVTTSASKSTSYTPQYGTTVPPFTLTPPVCSPTATTMCLYGPNCDLCTIYGGTVRLLYWPTSTASSFVGNTTMATTNTTTSTAPVVAIVEGVTITSPSVAISFATAYAINDCNSAVGQNHTASIVTMAPGDISSALGNVHYLQFSFSSGTQSGGTHINSASFNYQDLNWP